VRRALFPVLIVSQTLPLVAIAPLVVLWFGFGLMPKIMLVALVTFFPMMVALVQGYEATEKEIGQMLRAMGQDAAASSCWRACLGAALFLRRSEDLDHLCRRRRDLRRVCRGCQGLGIYMLNAKNNFRPRPGAGSSGRQRDADADPVRHHSAGTAPGDALGTSGKESAGHERGSSP
jgi:hypothetical protein